MKIEGRADGSLRVQHARYIDAFAAIDEKAFNSLRQVTVRILGSLGKVENVKAVTKPTRVLTVTGNQDWYVDWSTFRNPQHSGSTGAYSLDGFASGVDL